MKLLVLTVVQVTLPLVLKQKDRAQIFSTNETEFVWRKFGKLRTALFPYIYTAAHQVRQYGIPIMRHHILDFPSDTTVDNSFC